MKKKLSSGLYTVFDIGSSSVKAVVVEVENDRKRILKAESEAVNPASQFSSEEEYNSQITEALKKLSEKLGPVKSRKTSTLFYSRELQVKIIDLPDQVRVDQLDKVLVWEAKKLLSSHYKEETFAFAYSVVRERPLSVAIVVIPQVLLEAHIKLFSDAGIKVDSIYTDVFSALALQPIVDIAGLPALSIVNFGNSGTHLQIFSAGKLKFYRYIPTGTSELSDPPSESELEMYAQKIRFSFDYFRAVSKLSQVDNLYFMGGGSAFPEVLPFAQNYFSPTKVYHTDITSQFEITSILNNSDDNTATSDKTKVLLPYIPAIGACLADFSENSETMDLKTQLNSFEKAKNLEKLANTLPVVIGIVALLISSGILYYIYKTKSDTLEDLRFKLNVSQSELEANKIKIFNLNKNEDDNDNPGLCPESAKAIKPIIARRYSLNNLFAKIMTCREPGMRITEILIRNPKEAEEINMKEISQDDSGEEDSNQTEPLAPYTSKLTQQLSEQQLKEDMQGNIVIIHGIAKDAAHVAHFSEALTRNTVTEKQKKTMPSVIKNYMSINSRKLNKNQVEFLLKGEIQ